MKKLVLASATLLAAMNASADVGAMIGVTYAFGANEGVGFTLQATSTRHEDRGVAAVGVSYYPFSSGQQFGLPVGVGYQGSDVAGTVGYDFLTKSVVVSGGYINTRDDSKQAPAAPPVT